MSSFHRASEDNFFSATHTYHAPNAIRRLLKSCLPSNYTCQCKFLKEYPCIFRAACWGWSVLQVGTRSTILVQPLTRKNTHTHTQKHTVFFFFSVLESSIFHLPSKTISRTSFASWRTSKQEEILIWHGACTQEKLPLTHIRVIHYLRTHWRHESISLQTPSFFFFFFIVSLWLGRI